MSGLGSGEFEAAPKNVSLKELYTQANAALVNPAVVPDPVTIKDLESLLNTVTELNFFNFFNYPYNGDDSNPPHDSQGSVTSSESIYYSPLGSNTNDLPAWIISQGSADLQKAVNASPNSVLDSINKWNYETKTTTSTDGGRTFARDVATTWTVANLKEGHTQALTLIIYYSQVYYLTKSDGNSA